MISQSLRIPKLTTHLNRANGEHVRHLMAVVEHPEVVKGALSGTKESELNVPALLQACDILLIPHGAIALHYVSEGPGYPTVMEAHFLIAPEGRGPAAHQAFDEALAFAFTVLHAEEVVGRFHESNGRVGGFAKHHAAQVIAKADGWTYCSHGKTAWIAQSPLLEADGLRLAADLQLPSVNRLVATGLGWLSLCFTLGMVEDGLDGYTVVGHRLGGGPKLMLDALSGNPQVQTTHGSSQEEL